MDSHHKPKPPLKIAVLISGGGTTLRNLIDHVQHQQLPIDIRLVISSKAQVAGLQYAEAANLPYCIISHREYASPEAFRDANFEAIKAAGCDYVVMAGYLRHLLIPKDYEGRVINIHPSLIPAFCGKGMYGIRVHQAAIDFGVKISGCTVHFVDNEYDHGPIILQRSCSVEDGDTPESLQRRVFALECQALPEALRKLHHDQKTPAARA